MLVWNGRYFSLHPAWFGVAFSAHFFAEFLRRFIYYSDSIYLIADCFIFIVVIRIVCQAPFVVPPKISLLAFGAFCLFGIVSLLLSGNAPILFLIGLRPFLLGFCAFLICAHFFLTRENAAVVLFRIVCFWGFFICSVGILQILLGLDSWVNKNDAVHAGIRQGIGDYTAPGLLSPHMFRPTSIFGHTGRFGQISYLLVIFSFCYLCFERPVHWAVTMFVIIFGLVMVIVSGQRAATVFLTFGCLLLFFRSFFYKVKIAPLIGILSTGIIAWMALPEGLSRLILFRAYSGFYSAIDRVLDMFRYVELSVDKYFWLGEGFGFFSFGGGQFGGFVYYEYMSRLVGGGGESSWLRLQGEVGLIGLIFFCFFYFVLTGVSIRNANFSRDFFWIHFLASYTLISMGFWSLTHDVFGNYLSMIFIFGFVGCSQGLYIRSLVSDTAGSRRMPGGRLLSFEH